MYTVRRQTGSRTWGIFKGAQLIEGGFFSRGAAQDACDEWSEGQVF